MLAFPFPRRPMMIALSLLGVIVIGGIVVAPKSSRAEAPATAPSTELSGLQQQRIETLRQASDVAHRMFEKGMTAAEEVFRIDRSLLDAQLESATAADDRVKLLQNALELARKQEDLVTRQQESGVATLLARLEAKADRLRIEIRLAELTAK